VEETVERRGKGEEARNGPQFTVELKPLRYISLLLGEGS